MWTASSAGCLGCGLTRKKRGDEGGPYFLGFWLYEGTSVVRPSWFESSEVGRGVMDEPLRASLRLNALPGDHQARWRWTTGRESQSGWPLGWAHLSRPTQAQSASFQESQLSQSCHSVPIVPSPTMPLSRSLARCTRPRCVCS